MTRGSVIYYTALTSAIAVLTFVSTWDIALTVEAMCLYGLGGLAVLAAKDVR